MDCHMPQMDGYEATRRFRALETASPPLPIIAMTANVNRGDSDKCLAVGMSDYLSKPLKLTVLRSKLHYWLGTQAASAGLPAAQKENAASPPASNPLEVCVTLDRHVLSELRASVGDAFCPMIEVFLEDMPLYLEQLQSAINEKKAKRLREIAHSIKGSARNFGATQLAQVAKQLEELGQRGTTAGAQELFTQLTSAYQHVKAELQHEQQPDQEATVSKEAGQCRVLIVDDDRGMRLALRNVLAQDGYQIEEAENGEQALALCERRLPDLVLMDALMPVMSGFKACARIRKLPEGAHTPVLIITALEDENSIKQAFSAGATDYIPKPVHFAVLRRRVARLLDASRAEKHVYQLAYHDTLTGLPNRVSFRKRLEEAIARSSAGEKLAILFLDLDRFKLVNDTLGHDVGDLLLKAAAERISGCLRAGDMVARLGGDEFTIILENIRSPEVVERIAREICEALSSPFVFVGQEMYISTSIGIALYPRDGKDISALIKHADTAMFRAKERGNGFQFYEQGMETGAARRLVMEAALRRALERNEFALCYQPQANPATGKLAGFEALIRWHHPERGLVSPTKFIPLAEETGLIIPIGEWVLREACTQTQAWLQRGLGPLQIAVNVSGRQLEKGDLAAKVMAILKETGLPPELLELEITESVVMQHAETVIPMFRELRAIGVKLAIDDFGTGYSSLNSLKRFPVDTLKIDRSFICDIATNPDDTAILAGIIALARSLRLKVVAEGVETREQEAILKTHWCDLIQGFYLSQPLSAAVVEQTLLMQERQGQLLSANIFPLSAKKEHLLV
jgi:diguanylate cyclase (GGDEF)-like protein